ncbi:MULTISPECIES: hypothetical protein [unclassified Flavobacterium]|uniref:hypothetical protein n=1 Tax=unclassified Flavobacterium TaxID=196869 RepID=UPI00131D1332|nr:MULTISPECIES: hypothetical protein [unclassified Flavobacterium]
MKTITNIFNIALLFIFINANAQTFEIKKSEISYENKLRPCLVSDVDQSEKDLKNAWVKYAKKNLNIKIDGIGIFSDDKILKAEDVTIASISKKRFNLYTRIAETPTGSEMKLFASYGYDIFLGEENYVNGFNAMEKIMNRFLYETLNDYYTEEGKSLNKSITKLKKENLNETKSINKNEKSINKINLDLDKNKVSEYDDSDAKIKKTSKLNKLTSKKASLESENRESKLNNQNLEVKIKGLSEKLEIVKTKQEKLMKPTL